MHVGGAPRRKVRTTVQANANQDIYILIRLSKFQKWHNSYNKRPKGPHIVHLSTICHHFCLLIGPENTKLVEDVEILLPVKFRLNSVQRFERRSRKCLSQSEARMAILFF